MPVGNVAMGIPANRLGWPEMLKQRIFTALIALSVLAVVLFVVPEIVARIVIVALFLAGAWEWAGFLFTKNNERKRWIFVGFVALAIGMLLLNLPDAALIDTILKAALVWWAIALTWLFFFPTNVPKFVSWVCGTLVLVPAWAALDYRYLSAPDLLLFVLLIVWVADIGAYFVGKGFGRVKLAPEISPGKTWEGVFGGLCAVFLLAAVGSRFVDIEISILVPFCIAVAMLSVVGDLTVSMFKRSAGVKDSGTLFPGHGGVLDRIDSVTAAAPLFAVALTWIGAR
jgi:phosphatidate cytidylyltransferase